MINIGLKETKNKKKEVKKRIKWDEKGNDKKRRSLASSNYTVGLTGDRRYRLVCLRDALFF